MYVAAASAASPSEASASADCSAAALYAEYEPSLPSMALVSIAARWLTVCLALPGAITASCMSLGRNSLASARTWTWSTRPISSGSVPGRAWRPSALSGSGPWSSWYSRVVQPDQVPSVRVRTSKLRSFSDGWTPWAQVTPTEP